jgi:hypothetical protein
MLDGLLDARARHGEDRFLDVDYHALAADPLATAGEIYDWLGWPLTDDAEREMRGYLAEATAGRFGTHHYELSTFGLTPEMIRERVPAYCERFGF